MLSRNESRHSCLASKISGKAFALSPLSIVSAIGLLQMLSIKLKIPYIPRIFARRFYEEFVLDFLKNFLWHILR